MQYLPGVTLDVASRVYVASETKINKQFLQQTKSIFQSTCKRLNTKDPESCAAAINNWVTTPNIILKSRCTFSAASFKTC